MTVTANAKPSASQTDQSKNDTPTRAMVTLEQLATELKMLARDARMLLRLAAKQTKQYPNLGKDHVARQPWQWKHGSKALEEAKNALKSPA